MAKTSERQKDDASKSELQQSREFRKMQLEEKNKAKKETRRSLIAFLVLISIVMIGYISSNYDTSSQPNNDSSTFAQSMPDEMSVMVIGKRFIEKQVSTNSVEFEGTPKIEINSADSTYYVIGHITYVNIYNAPMKSLFTMKLKYLGGGQDHIANYKLQSFQFDK